MKINGTKKLVHRVSYELHNGPIPDGLCVLHKCDNPKCCNPEHLFLGTQQENMADMHTKGRFVKSKGNAILNLQKAKEIRQKFIETTTCKELATEYGVHYDTIWKIVRNRRWKE